MSVQSLCSSRFTWLSLIGLAMLLRLGVMLQAPERLTADRDLYLGIAREMGAGHGYSTPGSDPPRATAFRPPLYPLLLLVTGGGAIGVGALHLLLAGVMVVATGLAAMRFAGSDSNSCWTASLTAAGIVAIDPLLVLYSGQPMTETLCSCLSAGLLAVMSCNAQAAESSVCGQRAIRRSILIGLTWGLCLLARPTYAAALALWLVGSVVIPGSCPGGWSVRLRSGLLVGAVTLGVLSPWVIRNWQVFGHPIATTTHGGYTLWLANNPVYYTEVVEGPDIAWSGDSLSGWQTITQQEMDRHQIQGEVAQDRWQSDKARDFIRQNPGRFAQACMYRATRFWSIWTGRPGDTGLPAAALWAIAIGYAVLWFAGIFATSQAVLHRQWQLLLATGSLILGFFLVHLVYWTDARMRAPIMPAIAVLIAVGLPRAFQSCRSRKPTPEYSKASDHSA